MNDDMELRAAEHWVRYEAGGPVVSRLWYAAVDLWALVLVACDPLLARVSSWYADLSDREDGR